MRHKYIPLFLIIIVLPLIIIFNSKPFYSKIRNKTVSIVTPVFKGAHFIFYNFSEGLVKIRGMSNLYKSYEALKDEVDVYREKLIELEELRLENARLTELLNFKKDVTGSVASLQVIGRDVSPFSHWIVVNAGEKKIIEKNMPIVAPGGLVGKVFSVNHSTARCILIIDPQSNVSALVQSTRDTGVLLGMANEDLKLQYLPLDSEVKVGDTVVTSGLGGVYPKGLAIGHISAIGSDRNGLHLYARVTPFVDFIRLEEVVCLKKSN